MGDKDPLEMILTECFEEIGQLKHNFLYIIKKFPHYSTLLITHEKLAQKLLYAYKYKTIDEDIIIAALEGLLHNVGRIRNQLEAIGTQLDVEKKFRGKQMDKYIG